MKLIKTAKEMQNIALKHRAENNIIGFVPTMGFLHDGHLSLVKKAQTKADITIVSIFVNPTQFAPNEDLSSYPRDLDRDLALLENENVDYVFFPEVEEIYPENYSTYVNVENLSTNLCGKSRPSHFKGVTTIVTKLFNITLPHFAVFGQKDAQQAFIIKRMTTDLALLPEIIISPIVREKDGLAMSSRNTYLKENEREVASDISKALGHAKHLIQNGEKQSSVIINEISKIINTSGLFKIDYIEIVDIDKLQIVETIQGEVLIAVAAYLGKPRLIDNIIIKV